MNSGPQKTPSVFAEFFADAKDGNDEFAVMHLGEGALTLPFLVEEELLVPLSFVRDVGAGSTMTFELVFTAAWEAVEPLARHGVNPALGAQVLAALGGNPQRADADPQRYLRLTLSALEAFRGRGMSRHEGRAYLAIGTALERCRRMPDALTAYERGRALLEEAGDEHGLRAAHARLALVMGEIGLIEQSLLHAEAGLRIGRSLTAPTGPTGRPAMGQAHITHTLHLRRARALMLMGFDDDAESALADWRREAGDGDQFDRLVVTGQLRLRQNRNNEAVDVFIRAIDTRFAALDTATLPGRTHYLENSAKLFGEAIGAALSIGRADLVVGMLAAMATRRPRRPQGPAPGGVRPLDEEIRTLARKATSAAVAGDASALTAHDDRARILLETRDALVHGARSGKVREPVTVADLTRAVLFAAGHGELALAYAQSSQNEIVVLAVTDGTVLYRTAELPADRLSRLVALAHDECVRRTDPQTVRHLGKVLLAPVADLLATASRVFVTAQGPLADFPFHAAPFHDKPLVASVQVRTLPSLALLGSAGERRRRTAPQGAALRARVATVRQPRYEVLPELPTLRTEAEAVRRAFPAAVALHDDEATAHAVREAVESCDVLHLAGHAAFDPAHPNMARILLADRPLFAFEVATASAAPQLVNLSGCRAAAERRNLGGEGEGLAASFLAAGAETVVAPLWPVRDDAALAFNSILYGQLARPGTQVGTAVRNAQLALLADPKFAHPGLWGAFTILGGL
ncbi:CHAT domain-containing protein [Streptomyces sp. NPDC002619]|uniref:CHAT domain-containing protein n=1 Tax=Streptomyces sp. NPDC002619 TaxID=3364655 RepID=UPI0036AE21D2